MTEPDTASLSNDDAAQRILLVTGLSGAGKSTALHELEDMGWEIIDNFPIRLLPGMIATEGEQHAPLAIGFDSRTRGFVPHEITEMVKEYSRADGISITTLFIDCGSAELERRYNETRRRHPMAAERPVREGILAERELLEPLRRWADLVIDTTDLSSNHLQQVVRDKFSAAHRQPMTVTISSFGFARGMPPLADLVFDMRFLDNPHWIAGLREQTGLDGPVGDHILSDAAFEPAFAKMKDLVLELLPRYAAQGRSYLNIAFGCTGGRHRSVFTAETMADTLREQGFSPTVIHRNLKARQTDELEGR